MESTVFFKLGSGGSSFPLKICWQLRTDLHHKLGVFRWGWRVCSSNVVVLAFQIIFISFFPWSWNFAAAVLLLAGSSFNLPLILKVILRTQQWRSNSTSFVLTIFLPFNRLWPRIRCRLIIPYVLPVLGALTCCIRDQLDLEVVLAFVDSQNVDKALRWYF